MTDSTTSAIDTSDMPPVHRVFRSSLASGADLVASTKGNDERRQVVANYYLNLIEFLEVHHDGEEKLVFPLLNERALDARATVAQAVAQHEEVVGSIEAVKGAVNDWEAVGDSRASGAAETLAALERVLIPHLDQEEDEILPLAGAHLTEEEWGKLPGHAMGNFKGDKIWLVMGLIRENFTQAQRDRMLANMPPPAREMWETMGEASFKALIAEVRQSA